MRGRREEQEVVLAHVVMEGRVPKDHPLRTVKSVADEVLQRLSPEFDKMYSRVGRASVPPESLLKGFNQPVPKPLLGECGVPIQASELGRH